MTEHIFDELPAILRGEATRSQVESAATHLRRCPDCQQELISALVAHASLSSAARVSSGDFSFRSSRDVKRAAANADDSLPSLPAIGQVSADALPAGLPDLSDLFAQVRAEAAQADSSHAKSGTTRARTPRGVVARGRWVLVAAAVVILGVGGGSYVATHHRSTATATTVALAAYDQGHDAASAKVTGADMHIDATALPKPQTGKLYEVWLTNAQRTRMHALGWIDSNGKGDFTVPAALMGEYSAIEVSVQDLGGSYDYSGVSVLRGSY